MPVHWAAMSLDDRPLTRAEARRRARLAARGELPQAEDVEPEPAPAPRGGGILGRIFPPVPPLPGKPDPLAGYAGSGALRPVSVRLFLLRHNLLAWLPTGLLAFLGLIASLTYGPNPIGLVGTFALFGAIIAAGWFGWQRPTLFGTAAAAVGFTLTLLLIVLFFSSRGAGITAFGTPLEVVGGWILQGIYYLALGFLGGWYGGYLRRRQAQLGATQRARQRRR
jgi:hypothetical protein